MHVLTSTSIVDALKNYVSDALGSNTRRRSQRILAVNLIHSRIRVGCFRRASRRWLHLRELSAQSSEISELKNSVCKSVLELAQTCLAPLASFQRALRSEF